MIVLDCSATIEFARVKDPESPITQAILDADMILAPTLLKYELASVWRKYVKAGVCSVAQAADEMLDTIDLIDFFEPADGYMVEALFEAARLDHSPYDMFYLLMAKRNAAMLVTCDKALGRLCRAEGVVSLGWE